MEQALSLAIHAISHISSIGKHQHDNTMTKFDEWFDNTLLA